MHKLGTFEIELLEVDYVSSNKMDCRRLGEVAFPSTPPSVHCVYLNRGQGQCCAHLNIHFSTFKNIEDLSAH